VFYAGVMDGPAVAVGQGHLHLANVQPAHMKEALRYLGLSVLAGIYGCFFWGVGGLEGFWKLTSVEVGDTQGNAVSEDSQCTVAATVLVKSTAGLPPCLLPLLHEQWRTGTCTGAVLAVKQTV
jgi:hypothetical protein